jgi:sugar lactone lactonase YvrE
MDKHLHWWLMRGVLALSLLNPCASYAEGDVDPVNDLPNPYRTAAPWGQLPAGQNWGALSAVTIDNDGSSVWAASRCGANPDVPPGVSPFLYDSCAGSKVAPVMKFDASGKLLKAFGAGLFIFPHKIAMDPEGNIWVVDQRSMNERERAEYPADANKGHTVVKFSPDGRVLMTLGKPGVAGNPPEALTEPTSIAFAPNGNLYISEGHSGQAPNAPPDTVARISVFTRDGKFLKSFGALGNAPGQFRTPHDILFDERGRLVVADRGNMRIQFLDLDGNYLAQWKHLSRPSGIAIRGGMIYVADSESNGVAPHPGWQRGIRIGSYPAGRPLVFIPDPLEMKGTSAAEGIAVDAQGNIYGAEVGPRQLVRHAK